MTTVEMPVVKPHRSAMKLLRIGRHRLTRWFRPPEAEVVRRQHAAPPHPLPVAPPPAVAAAADRQG